MTEVERASARTGETPVTARAKSAVRMIWFIAATSISHRERFAAELDSEGGALGALHGDRKSTRARFVDREAARCLLVGLDGAHDVVGLHLAPLRAHQGEGPRPVGGRAG